MKEVTMETKKKEMSYLVWIDLIAMIVLFLTRGIEGKVAVLLNLVSGILALPLCAFIIGRYVKTSKQETIGRMIKWAITSFIILNIVFPFVDGSHAYGNIILNPVTYSWILLAIPIWWFTSHFLEKSKQGLALSILLAILVGNLEGIGDILGITSIAALFPFSIAEWKEQKDQKWALPTLGAIACFYGLYYLKAYSYIFYFETAIEFEQIKDTRAITLEPLLARILVYPVSWMAIKGLHKVMEQLPRKLDHIGKRLPILPVEHYIIGLGGAIVIASLIKISVLYQEINRLYFWTGLLLGIVATILLTWNIKHVQTSWQKLQKRLAERRDNKKKKEEKQSKNSNKLTSFFNSNYMVVLLGIILFLKTGLMYYQSWLLEETFQTTSSYFLCNLGYIACLLIPLFCIKKNKTRMTAIILVDLFISSLLFADNLYYNYSGNYISVYQIGNLQYGGEISRVLPMLLKPIHLWYFIDLIVLIAIRLKVTKNNEKTNNLPILASILVCISLMAPLVSQFRDAGGYPYDKKAQLRIGGIYGYHIQDLLKSASFEVGVKIKKEEAMEEAYQEIKEFYQEEGYIEPSPYHAIAKGKNIILLQLESIGDFPINQTYQGKEITPNLNKFFEENIRFTNSYMQSFSSTADSEFSVATSLFPLENGMSFSKYPNITYPDLFHVLKTKGNYQTAVLHGNDGNFWNRTQVYRNFEVDKTIFESEFDENVDYYMNYISDDEVYQRAIQEMKQEEGTYLYNIIAASSHIPFTLKGMSDEVRSNLAIQQDGTELTDYIQSVNYADQAFGNFIQGLKENGLYEDTLIIVYGDHTGYSARNNEQLKEYLESIRGKQNNIQLVLEDLRVAMGMHIPGVKEQQEITKPINKLDIKPTILDLLGIEDEFSLGTSAFGTKDYTDLNNGNIITQDYYRDGNVWYEIETGKPVDWDQLAEDMQDKLSKWERYNTKKIDISQAIPAKNLLKNRTF